MPEMRYTKTFRAYLLIPGAHLVWLPLGLVFLVPELTGHLIPVERETGTVLGLVFCSIGLVAAVVTLGLAAHLRRRDRRRRFLYEHGLRAEGTVAEVSATPTRVNDRQLMRLRITSPEVPGLSFTHLTYEPLPQGARVTVAYDPEDLGTGVLVEA